MAQAHADAHHYFVPHSSRWPFLGSIALFTTMVGLASWFNEVSWGKPVFFFGIALMCGVLFGWFGDVIRESIKGNYNKQVDTSFRMGMVWFIFSEVMFFAAFFGALFYVRNLSVPDLGSIASKLLWPNYAAQWPTNGPYETGQFAPMGAMGIPLINTIILLTSGVTLTIAHHALKAGHRGQLKLWLFLTIALGFLFVGLQAYEYHHAYSEMNLKLSTGVYGSTFFMLTGFHGLHVTIGATMLLVMLIRVFKGHFTADHHFAFEASAWYWHFVDVVWLLLFVLVYWLV